MRTTITLEDNLYNEIREISHTRKIPIKTAINLVIATGLGRLKDNPEGPEYTQQTFALGTPYAEYDLVKAMEVSSELEVAELKRKLDLRK